MSAYKKILVFGKHGQLAKSIAQRFNGENIHFVSQKDLDLRFTEKIAPFVKSYGPSLVINAAAYTQVDLAESEEKEAELINVLAPQQMAIACGDGKIPLIHFSTDYVFNGSKSDSYSETDKTQPLNVYGKTKLLGELEIQSNCEKYLIFRVSWLYSEFGKNFFLTMLRLGKEHQQLKIVSDQAGSPTYTREIAQMIHHILPELHDNWGVYHFANSGSTTWYDFALEIFELARQLGITLRVNQVDPILTSDYPTPARRPANSLFNLEKFERTFSYRPSAWRDALDSCFSAHMSV